MRRDTEAQDERALPGTEHTPLGIIRAFMRRVGWLPKPPPLEPPPREPGEDDEKERSV